MLPKFFVANDASDTNEAINKTKLISGVSGNYGIKLNLDLVLKDINIISEIAKLSGKPIFVDMKMWNGRRTMAEVICKLADLGVSMTNVWAQAEDMLADAVRVAQETGIALFGLTVLTHYDDTWCKKFYGRNLNNTVRLLAKTAMNAGCDGYILPGTCLKAVSNLRGLKFNPAVRPAWYGGGKNYQKQIVEPGVAIRGGADVVSCGSPVFESSGNPAKALRLILEEVESSHLDIQKGE